MIAVRMRPLPLGIGTYISRLERKVFKRTGDNKTNRIGWVRDVQQDYRRYNVIASKLMYEKGVCKSK